MGDYWATPWGAGSSDKIPGVLVHAHMVSQIISSVLDKRLLLWVWSGWEEILWMGFWAVVGGAIAWRYHRLLIMGVSVVFSVIILLCSCWILLNVGGWVSLIAPVACLLLTNGTVFYTFLLARLG